MNLRKAIEIKENHQRLHLDEYYSELLEADNLSIEAMKRCQLARKEVSFVGPGLLPGETE
ncbi:hypothetical protein ES703_69286 [subsurface metagenome]